MMLARVKYHIATYSGVVQVNVEDDADHDTIIAKARGTLRRQVGVLPFGSESWRVLRDGEATVDVEDES